MSWLKKYKETHTMIPVEKKIRDILNKNKRDKENYSDVLYRFFDLYQKHKSEAEEWKRKCIDQHGSPVKEELQGSLEPKEIL